MALKLGLLPGPWKQSLRRILRIPFSAHVTNSAIYQLADQIPVSEMVLSRRLQFFGHVARCDAELDHARAQKAMIGPPPRTCHGRSLLDVLDKPGCEGSRLTCSL